MILFILSPSREIEGWNCQTGTFNQLVPEGREERVMLSFEDAFSIWSGSKMVKFSSKSWFQVRLGWSTMSHCHITSPRFSFQSFLWCGPFKNTFYVGRTESKTTPSTRSDIVVFFPKYWWLWWKTLMKPLETPAAAEMILLSCHRIVEQGCGAQSLSPYRYALKSKKFIAEKDVTMFDLYKLIDTGTRCSQFILRAYPVYYDWIGFEHIIRMQIWLFHLVFV